MNFFLFSVILSAAVLCSDSSNRSTSTSNSSTKNNELGEFVRNWLPHLYSLSRLSDFYKRDVNSLSKEQLSRYLRFFEDVRIHYELNDNWEGTFWGVCNNHPSFVQASRKSVEDAMMAVLAWYDIKVEGDKESVKAHLLSLYQPTPPDFVMTDAALYLFLTFLGNATIPLDAHVADEVINLDKINEKVAEDKRAKLSVPDLETMKKEIVIVSDMCDFFVDKKDIEKVSSRFIRTFLTYVKPLYFQSDATGLETKWMSVFNAIFTQKYPKEAAKKQARNLDIAHVLKKHSPKLPELKWPSVGIFKADLKFDVEKIMKKYLGNPEFELSNRSCAVVCLCFLAFYPPPSS